MRLKSVSVRSFRGFGADATLRLGRGLNLVVGGNGRGKSSLLNAIEWCLFGRQVEKSSSGLAERKAWEVPNRYARAGDTVVRLLWDIDGAEVQLTRARAVAARRTQEDSVKVELANGELITGEEADLWLEAHGMPDWAEWRSSYCQHQEAARDRLLTKDNRTVALVALLGLDEVARFKKDLDGLKLQTARKAAKDAEQRVNEDIELLQPSPRDLEGASADLTALDIDPETVTRQSGRAVLAQLREAATLIEARLGVSTGVPTVFSDLDEAVRWAAGWSAAVRRAPSPMLATLGASRERQGALATALNAIEPLQQAVEEARQQVAESIDAGGAIEARTDAVQAAKDRLQEVEERRRLNSRLASLLGDARAVVQERTGEECPVCLTRVEGLDQSIAARLEAVSTAQAQELDRAADGARASLQSTQDAVAAQQGLEHRLEVAEGELATRQQLLARLVPDFEGADVVAAARAAGEQLATDIDRLSNLQTELDDATTAHARSCDEVRAMVRYLEALERQDQHIEIEDLPAWETFRQALDELVALTADCEALAVVAKNVLAETSDLRLKSVNQSLGKYFAMITGDRSAASRRLEVVSHSTAKQLDYRIVDGRGAELAPILNQAALNAVAMAMLFAQAEGAPAGGPSLLVLDDPEQSLDEEHIGGLARALDEAAKHRDILVAVTPGRLEERVRRYSTSDKHFVYLDEWDPQRGAAFTTAG